MIRYKDFFIRMCEAEEVSAHELQELTGKSKTVVYGWLNYSNVVNIPSYDSLSKIICRLGITIDDFIKCKSDKLVDYTSYRSYKEYIRGNLDNQYFIESILDTPNYEYILNCFLTDCIKLKSMITEYLNGIEIDIKEFNNLCNHIKPCYYSEVMLIDDIGDAILGYLDSNSLLEFKYRNEVYKERIDDDPEYKENCIHEIYVPSANYILLHISNKNVDPMKRYLRIINDTEKNKLMSDYLKYSINNKKFDKKRKIFKLLNKNNCELKYCKEQDINKLYNNG